MKRLYVLGFLGLMLCDTGCQTFSKLSTMAAGEMTLTFDWLLSVLHTPWVYVTLACALGSFCIWITLMKTAPVGASFAASYLELVPVTMVSVFFFHEPLNIYKILGGLCILAGVYCLAKGEEAEERRKTWQHPA